MGLPPRQITTEFIYSNTQRTVDRAFLFKPTPEIRNIIGASAGRAQKKYPVHIYWLEFNSNHEHEGIAPISNSKKHLNNIVLFKQYFHRLVARELNRTYHREGPIFSSPSRNIPCLDNESVEKQFFYALTNPVKDGLVDKISHWKGFSSYSQQTGGKQPVYKFFNRTAWHEDNKKKDIQNYLETVTVKFTAIPSLAHMKPHKREAHIRREVKKLEQHFRKERKRDGKTVMTAARLENTNPRDRPATNKKNTPLPICHSASIEATKRYKDKFKDFIQAYYRASALYRQGAKDYFFPAGSYKPPLICLAAV